MKKFATNDRDITDKEYEENYIPLEKTFREYMSKYIVPEVIAYQIAGNHYKGILVKSPFLYHYNSMVNAFTYAPKFEEVKDEIISLLKIKYNLKVEKEEPLVLSKYR